MKVYLIFLLAVLSSSNALRTELGSKGYVLPINGGNNGNNLVTSPTFDLNGNQIIYSKTLHVLV